MARPSLGSPPGFSMTVNRKLSPEYPETGTPFSSSRRHRRTRDRRAGRCYTSYNRCRYLQASHSISLVWRENLPGSGLAPLQHMTRCGPQGLTSCELLIDDALCSMDWIADTKVGGLKDCAQRSFVAIGCLRTNFRLPVSLQNRGLLIGGMPAEHYRKLRRAKVRRATRSSSLERSTVCNSPPRNKYRRPWLRGSPSAPVLCRDPALQTCS